MYLKLLVRVGKSVSIFLFFGKENTKTKEIVCKQTLPSVSELGAWGKTALNLPVMIVMLLLC